MRTVVPLLLLGLIGQSASVPATMSLGAAYSPAGASAVLAVWFASEGNSIVAVQFDLEYDNSVMNLAETVGVAVRDSAKNLKIVELGSGRKRYLVSGLNQNPISDGALLNVFVNLSASAPAAVYPLKISNLVASDPSGEVAPINSADGIVTVETDRAGLQLQPAGILNGASFLPGSIAPGEIVTLIGSGIAPDSGSAGVRVLFDGLAAPILYVGPNQINAVVPYGISGKNSTRLQLTSEGQLVADYDFPVVEAAPGIFTLDASGTGPGVIFNQDSTLNTPADPAPKGSLVTVFAHGAGQTSPPGVDGQISGDILAKPVLPVSVQIAGLDADVQYAGAASGMIAGVLKVICMVPASAPSGYSVPVVLTVGQAVSQAGVTLAIR